MEFLTREHLGSVLADQISTCETAEQSKILPSCPESETNEGACYLCPCAADQIETDIDMARRVGDPEKNVVYVFDVFDVFACLRFSLKRIFIINVSDVFDVFSVFSISPPKN